MKEKIAPVLIVLAMIGCQEQKTIEENKSVSQEYDLNLSGNDSFENQEYIDPLLQIHVKELIKKLGDEDFRIRESATNELILTGRYAIPYLERELKSDNSEVLLRCKIAIEAIKIRMQITFSEKLLKLYPGIYVDLATKEPAEKFEILHGLIKSAETEMGLNKTDEDDIANFVRAMVMDAEKLTVEQKISLCRICDGNYEFTDEGNGLIIYWHFNIPNALPCLKKFLKDNNPVVRETAIEVIVRLGKDTVNDIIPLLKDDDFLVRTSAVKSLGELDAKEAIDEIIPLLNDEHPIVRACTAKILGCLDAKEALKELFLLLKDENHLVRENVADALQILIMAEHKRDILLLLRDKERFVRETAVKLIVKLGKRSDIITDIIPLLKDDDFLTRASVMEALGELDANQTVREIIPLLDDEHTFVRRTAIHVLGKLGGKEAIDKIKLLLNDNERNIRIWAAVVLTELGVNADFFSVDIIKDVKTAYSELLKSGNSYSERFAEALRKLKITDEEIEKIKNSSVIEKAD